MIRIPPAASAEVRTFAKDVASEFTQVLTRMGTIEGTVKSLRQANSPRSNVELWPWKILTLATNTTLGVADIHCAYSINCTAGSDLTLPTASLGGWIYLVNGGGNTVTVKDGATTLCTLPTDTACLIRAYSDSSFVPQWPTKVETWKRDGTLTLGVPLGITSGGTGLSALGTANQLFGMNSGATAGEWKTVSGTSNQVTVTHGANSITLSTPQNIHTGASPTFAGLTLSGLTASRLVVSDGSKALASNASLTANGFTYPDGTGSLASTSAATNGQLLIGSTSSNPVAATLTGTANQITVTNGAGTITLSLPSDVLITSAGIAVTTTRAFGVQNTTTATSGVPNQWSPGIDWIGHVWQTGLGAADKTARFRAEVRTTSANPATCTWVLSSSVDTGTASFSDRLSVTSRGDVTSTGGFFSSSSTGGMGYVTGAGGTVTQATSKATGVTLSKACGQITMNNAALAAATSVSFTLTNSVIAATDAVVVNIQSAASADSYSITVDAVAAGSCRIQLRNISAGSLSEALVLNFAVIKAVAA